MRGFGHIYLRPGTTDAFTAREVLSGKQYNSFERDTFQTTMAGWYDAILRRGRRPLIIDAGANVGFASVWFARKFPEARIVAIEPAPDNVDMCRRNTAGLKVDVIEAAVGGESGWVSLTNELTEKDKDTYQTVRSSEGAATPVMTLSHIIGGYEPECELFIVKIDIEGFESDLFGSNTDWLADAKVVFIEPHDWMLPGRRSSQNFQREMSSRGFDISISGENLLYTRLLDVETSTIPSADRSPPS